MPTIGTLPGRAALGRRPRRRWRVALRRQPIAYWAVVLVAVITAWWGTQVALERVTEGADAYGNLVLVVVTTRDIAPGHTIGEQDVTIAEVPERLAPSEALTTAPIGAVARDHLVEGEAIASTRLAPDGAIGVAATLLPEERAVSIPTDGHRPPFRTGQRVDVLATSGPTVSGRDGPTTTVAAAARVLTVDEDGITVAVDLDEASDLATALATTIVTVVVTPE